MILDALKRAQVTADLVRCPMRGGPGTTNWYRVKSGAQATGIFSIQTVRGARPAEGFILTRGSELPPLQPTQLAAYSEECGKDVAQKASSSVKPHERLAGVICALLAGRSAMDWNTLTTLPIDVEWNPGGPKKVDLVSIGNSDPYSVGGFATYAQRKFSVLASGTQLEVKTMTFEEIGTHARGEHMLGVLYTKGIRAELLRCGPVYTESTNNWYSLSSTGTRPAYKAIDTA